MSRLSRKIRKHRVKTAARLFAGYAAHQYLARYAANATDHATHCDENPGVFQHPLPKPVRNRAARRALAKDRSIRNLALTVARLPSLHAADQAIWKLADAHSARDANRLRVRPLSEIEIEDEAARRVDETP